LSYKNTTAKWIALHLTEGAFQSKDLYHRLANGYLLLIKLTIWALFVVVDSGLGMDCTYGGH